VEVLDQYKEEIKADVKVDQLNILEKQLMLPALKHKWVARLIDCKKQLNKLKRKKNELKASVMESISKSIPSKIPKVALEAKIESSEKIKEITAEMDEIEIIIDYLERVEKIFSAMSFDFTNMVNLIKMETT